MESSEAGDEWTIPVSSEVIERARQGDWSVILTPTKPVPRSWLGELAGARVLCLASGGGQQSPILAAAGAIVTALDNSPEQLARDRYVATREELEVTCELGTMTDLSLKKFRTVSLNSDGFSICSPCEAPGKTTIFESEKHSCRRVVICR